MKRWIRETQRRLLDAIQTPAARKRRYALGYWKERLAKEGTLSNSHYERFYTDHFGLDREFYRDKRILDIGCGPRGSLEWAAMARSRIGIDPLANAYRRLAGHRHEMEYVEATAEAIPYEDGHFDVVCSFNSLDHVDDIERAADEIIRVLAPGGLFLVITEVHDRPTIREPQTFRWEIVDRFAPPLTLLEEARYERARPGIYQSVTAQVPYDDTDDSGRYGVLSGKFVKDA